MTQSIFTKLTVIIKAEDDEVNNNFSEVEQEYVDFYFALEELVESTQFTKIFLSITED